jgi:nucleoside-diphosphate-sugar epimerase
MVSRVTCEASPAITIDTNVSGTNNIVQLCRQFSCKLIHFSTSEVYGNIGGILSEDRQLEPNNIYGLSKKISEDIVRYYLSDAIIVRPFMFYDERETRGDHRSVMIRFAQHLCRREKIMVHRDSWRSWLHIEDGVVILEKLLYVRGFEIVNIGHEELVNTMNLAKLMCDYLGLDYSYIIEVDLPEKMTLTKHPDVSKQLMLTGAKPTINITEGVKRVLDYVKQH